MKRILYFACAVAVSTGAFAQLYKWVDKDGRVTYSDQPPPAQESKQINVHVGAPSAPRVSAVEKNKELDAKRLEAKEQEKASEQAEKKKEIDAENCNRAKAYLRTVEAGGRIATVNAQGEQMLLDDQQIEAERAKAQKLVQESCKSS
jgi:hypothetical protein